IVIYTRRVESGIGNSKLKVFEQPCLLQIDPVLYVMPPSRRRNVGLYPPIQKLPLLTLRGGSVVEQIAAGIITHLILADVWINRQKRVRAERMLITGRNVPSQHALVLVLRQLVVIVRYLKPASGCEQVEMENVLAR